MTAVFTLTALNQHLPGEGAAARRLAGRAVATVFGGDVPGRDRPSGDVASRSAATLAMTAIRNSAGALVLAATSGAWALLMLLVGWYRHSLVLSPCETSCGRSLGFVLLEGLGIALWLGSVGFALHALWHAARRLARASAAHPGWRGAGFAFALGVAWGAVVALSNAL